MNREKSRLEELCDTYIDLKTSQSKLVSLPYRELNIMVTAAMLLYDAVKSEAEYTDTFEDLLSSIEDLFDETF